MNEPWKVVGHPTRRLEGRQKLTGTATYVADADAPAAVWARLVLSPHPHARIRRVDTAEAQRLPGVLAVLTAADLAPADPGRAEALLLARDEVFYAGQPVAVVLAEDGPTAEDAAERVSVVYEPLPAVLDPVAAMRDDAPLVRTGPVQGDDDAEAHGAAGGGEVTGPKPRNAGQMVRYRRGDVDRGFASADVVIEGTYRVASVHQAYLEPRGCLARPEPGGTLSILTPTQGQFFARSETAAALGLAENAVRIVPTTVGGGFGGKIFLLEALAGALARRVGRPVRLLLDRWQDFLLSGPAPAAVVDLRLGALRDGRLVALQARVVFDAGALPGAPANIAALLLGGTYRVPHLDVVSLEVLTHKTPVAAYRAPGAPQAYFALESHMDRLARRLGVDPIDLRLRNAAREGDPRPDGTAWPRIGLVECLERLAQHPLARDRRREDGEGVGIAVGGWPGGTEPAAAACRLNRDGTLTVQVGSVDLTGTHTTLAMIAAEVFGLRVDQVAVAAGDTDTAPFAGMAGGSKITYTVGTAVLRAAEDAKRQVLAIAAGELEAAVDDLVLEGGRVHVRGAPSRSISLARIAELSTRFGGGYEPVHGQGRSALARPSPGFAAHLARVRVDRETGWARVAQYVAVQDVGRALNPPEVEGQIRGGVTQGIGRALFEALAYGPGGLANGNLADYPIPTAADTPEIAVELVEVPSPAGPFGAKGVGEPPVVPCAAAVANAVEDAVGVRITEVPIRPEAVVAALRAEA